jgi:uncharacterized protein (DUF58 family)
VATRFLVRAPAGTTAVRLRVSRPDHGTEEILLGPGPREIEVRAASVRTGRQPLFVLEYQGVGEDGCAWSEVSRRDAEQVLVLPVSLPVATLPLPGWFRGLTGPHDSRRPGSGGGFRDVHLFQNGDSPRRVDWRTTARRSPTLQDLYVRRTTSLGEAVVAVVVDSRDDVGPDPTTWNGARPVRADDPTSLDHARQAAATLAQRYLTAGDRVGVEDLGVRSRAVRTGTGRRQLDRVLHQLALVRPEGAPSTRVRPPRITAGALVYVVSTFLDDEAAVLARNWRRAGHPVVAVDVLPGLRIRGLDVRHRLALRLVLLERQDRLADLAAAGIEVVRWVDGPGATSRLHQLARAGSRRPGGRRTGAGVPGVGRGQVRR